MEAAMPTVSIALVKESNRRLSAELNNTVVARSSKLSQEAINTLMKKAFLRLTRSGGL
jgi:CRISPR/Cas system-associated protein Csm6